jgi:ABC-type Fe3+-siderophore transport system permease subunit
MLPQPVLCRNIRCVILCRCIWVLLTLSRFNARLRPEAYNQMRLKLVLISSLIAAVVGAGSAVAIILFIFSSLKPIAAPGLLVVSTYLLPTLATLLAAIFVYRHTAKRRKLQAVLTAIIAAVLTIAIFFLASVLTARQEPPHPQPDLRPNVGLVTH